MKMIEVKNLTFSYGKDKQALHGLNFSVADGEIFGFLGPNGSGKSTTQKILTGILKGHGGEVSLFGKDLKIAQTQEFFQQIGVLFEFPYLYANLSAVDNLNYFASFYPKEQLRDVKELLEELEFKKDFLNKPVSSYSKGMRQRVSMARALISNPKLLFLDEPTSGLDPGERVRFRNLLSEFAHDRIVLISTHIVSDVEYIATWNAVMKGGKLLACGTTEELVKLVEGKVWTATIPASTLGEYERRLPIVNLRNEENGDISIRYLAEEPSASNSAAVAPRLEDLYLWLFPQETPERR